MFENNIKGKPGDIAFAQLSLGAHVSPDPVKTIPLGLHGDGGAYSRQDSLFVISCNVLSGFGTTKQTRMVITTIKNQILYIS